MTGQPMYDTVHFTFSDKTSTLLIDMEKLQTVFNENATALKTLPLNYGWPNDPQNAKIVALIHKLADQAMKDRIVEPSQKRIDVLVAFIQMTKSFREGHQFSDFLNKKSLH